MDDRREASAPTVALVAGIEVPARMAPSLELPATALDVAQFIALRAAACVGADYSNIALLDASHSSLRLFHGSFLDPALADRYTDVPIDAPFPIAAAVRSGKPVVLPDLASYRDQYPEILADTAAAGVRCTASMPLYRSDGTPLGAIGFAWAEPPEFDLKLESALEAVAMLCTETVERARRYDEEHEIILELQRRMLDDLPRGPGLETAARYLPAGGSTPVGGDWYEGLRLGAERVAFVVGDVAGHGVGAAADMALVRGMISALLHSGVPVAEVFSEVSGVLRQRKALLLASAALVVVDAAAETLTFATAGHPPPLVLDLDRQVRFLDTANTRLIGLDKTLTIADTAPFPRGSQLIVFTDGLVERRDRSFSSGIEQMAVHLAALPAHLHPDALIDSLLDALIGDRTPDDD
ncbi:MAG TPA: GAF domain-containing SpoIIE family protein phosphatase, partial [Acidimicrobiia bacterium]|nr:GAF domain-containing SpoIIE family protein phosphatase [Acidimicrobiia bacterium]